MGVRHLSFQVQAAFLLTLLCRSVTNDAGIALRANGDILDLAADADIIHKSGAWYAYNGEKIGQGRENSKKYLEDHPDIAETVEHAIRVHYGLLEEDAENANNDPKAETQVSEE